MKQRRKFQQVLIMAMLMLTVSAANAQNSPKPQATKNNEKSKNTIFNVVDVLPSFPGGVKAFGDYLVKNIKYPAVDKKNKLEGKVFIQFVVERDGSLSNVQSVRSPSKAMSDEAVRVLKGSPKWNPGSMNNKPVRAKYTVPINFNLPA